MSLIADALKKVGSNPSRRPSPTPRWAYGLLFLGFVVLTFILSTNPQQQKIQPNKKSPGSYAKKQRTAVSSASDFKQQQSGGINLLRAANAQWRLNGIVHGGSGKPVALINNSLVEAGDTFRGARIVRVTEDQVEFETGGKIKTIRME